MGHSMSFRILTLAAAAVVLCCHAEGYSTAAHGKWYQHGMQNSAEILHAIRHSVGNFDGSAVGESLGKSVGGASSTEDTSVRRRIRPVIKEGDTLILPGRQSWNGSDEDSTEQKTIAATSSTETEQQQQVSISSTTSTREYAGASTVHTAGVRTLADGESIVDGSVEITAGRPYYLGGTSSADGAAGHYAGYGSSSGTGADPWGGLFDGIGQTTGGQAGFSSQQSHGSGEEIVHYGQPYVAKTKVVTKVGEPRDEPPYFIDQWGNFVKHVGKAYVRD